MSKKTVISLVTNIIESKQVKLIVYRDLLAFNRIGVTAMCPERQIPCNSSCVFFDLRKDENSFSHEISYRVVISCRSTILSFDTGI